MVPYSYVHSQCYVNMYESAIYFEEKPSATVHSTKSNLVLIRCSESKNRRYTLCFAVASKGTKLPLFFNFKNAPDGKIKIPLADVLPPNVFVICYTKRQTY